VQSKNDSSQTSTFRGDPNSNSTYDVKAEKATKSKQPAMKVNLKTINKDLASLDPNLINAESGRELSSLEEDEF